MLKKNSIKQAFANAASSYDHVASLQRQVGSQLLTMIDCSLLQGLVMDLGSGTGFLTRELLTANSELQLIALDLALPMLEIARHKQDAPQIRYLCADAERLPVMTHSLDTVCSNLALQWCFPLGKVLAELKRVLKPEGQLLFSTFGSQTLQELKIAWSEVDNYRHVNEFYHQNELLQILQEAGFKQIQLDCQVYLSNYDRVLSLLKELQLLGADQVMDGRNPQVTTKTRLQAMLASYEQFRNEQGIPATFEVFKVVAKA